MIAARLRVPSFAFTLTHCCCFFALIAAGAAQAQTGSFAQNGVSLGSVSVNTGALSKATLTFTFTTGGTIEAPAVVTQGAPNLDFTDAGTGTCTTNGTSHVYNANDTCTVVVKFVPRYAGAIRGAVVLYDSSGIPIATGYIHGNGTAPQIAFSPATQSTVPVSNGQAEVALAVDESGDLYLNNGSGLVKEAPSESGYVESPVAEVDGTWGTAVDGAGNVYASNGYSEVVKETLSSAGYAESALATSTSYNPYGWAPAGLAVDVAGNVYVDDDYMGVVVKETPAGSSYTESLVANGPNPGWALAVDGSGDVFVTAVFSPTIWKETPSDGGYTQTIFGSGLALNQEGAWGPRGLAVDGIGDVYVADLAGGSVVEERPESSVYLQSTLAGGFNTPWGIGVDGAGNIYFTNAGSEPVKLDVVDPPSLTFAPTGEAQTSTDSPQKVLLHNIGNRALSFSSITFPADFPEDPGQTRDCTTSKELPGGATCTLSIDFSPAPGSLSGTSTALSEAITLVDNNLNQTNVVHTIPVSGTVVVTAALTVAKQGLGTGTITSYPAGINCGGTCSGYFIASSSVTLWATVDAGSVLTNWSGCDSTASNFYYTSCTVTMNAARTVTATFSEPPQGAMAQPIDATTRSTTVAQADSVLIKGWAVDPQMGAPVSQVSVLIDGTPVGNATLGTGEPGVVARYNNFSYYNSGWTFTYPAAGLSVGIHNVTAVIADSVGLTIQIGPVYFSVAASPSYGPPFGAMGPAMDATTRSTTIATSDNLQVTGWAADPHDGAPVSSVSILIDGTKVGTATLGIARPDVAAAQNKARYLNSGWTFTMAASGLNAGTHTVSATASDSLGLSGTLGKQTITVAATSPDGPPFGSLGRAVDATTGQTTVSQGDNLLVEGWAADVHDGAPVSQVSILIDGTAVGHATLGIAQPGMAKTLGSRYMNSGWKFTMAASSLSAGTHTVTAVASDSLGLSTQFQIREITVTP